MQRNISGAGDQKSRAKPEHVLSPKERAIAARHAPGEIPQYLEVRKTVLQSVNEPPSTQGCPPGTRLLSEEEKAESIQDLTDQKEEITARLARLPLRLESPSLIREKKMMELELDEIEKSIEQLKKKYVFVPDD
jgi:hypothetical protein